MTDTPELWIGGGGSVTMMSKLLLDELEVVPAVGDDDPPVRVGEHLVGIVVVVAEHLGDDGTSSTVSVRRPAISALR